MSTVPRLLQAEDLIESDLLELYAYPDTGGQPWIRANYVVSVDGAIATNGTSSGLTTPLDQRVLKLLRELADVVLVGASTIRAEDYIGVRVSDACQKQRLALGLPPAPPIAVVSGRADIHPESRLLTNTLTPPIVLTTRHASAAAKRDLAAAGAEVVELGAETIETAALIDGLQSLGLRKIVCEGGPRLTGQLAADDALDELCVTTVPTIVSGTSRRLTHSDRHASTAMRCRHILFDADGAQLARWSRSEAATKPHPPR